MNELHTATCRHLYSGSPGLNVYKAKHLIFPQNLGSSFWWLFPPPIFLLRPEIWASLESPLLSLLLLLLSRFSRV